MDFLGFSRQNRDLSMGYEELPAKEKSRAPFSGAGATGREAVEAMRKGRIVHEGELNSPSDFLQAIVIRAVAFRPSGSKKQWP